MDYLRREIEAVLSESCHKIMADGLLYGPEWLRGREEVTFWQDGPCVGAEMTFHSPGAVFKEIGCRGQLPEPYFYPAYQEHQNEMIEHIGATAYDFISEFLRQEMKNE